MTENCPVARAIIRIGPATAAITDRAAVVVEVQVDQGLFLLVHRVSVIHVRIQIRIHICHSSDFRRLNIIITIVQVLQNFVHKGIVQVRKVQVG